MLGGWVFAHGTQPVTDRMSKVGPPSRGLTIRRRPQKGLMPCDLGGNHKHETHSTPGKTQATQESMSLEWPGNILEFCLKSWRNCLGRGKSGRPCSDFYCSDFCPHKLVPDKWEKMNRLKVAACHTNTAPMSKRRDKHLSSNESSYGSELPTNIFSLWSQWKCHSHWLCLDRRKREFICVRDEYE